MNVDIDKIRKIAKELSSKDDNDAMKRNVNEVETEHQKMKDLLKEKEKVQYSSSILSPCKVILLNAFLHCDYDHYDHLWFVWFFYTKNPFIRNHTLVNK